MVTGKGENVEGDNKTRDPETRREKSSLRPENALCIHCVLEESE